jgi:hypothetical protein
MNNQTKQELIKEIDQLVGTNFFLSKDNYLTKPLCNLFKPLSFRGLWLRFWGEVNTKKHIFTHWYFKEFYEFEELALLRLLIVEDFKQWIRELK